MERQSSKSSISSETSIISSLITGSTTLLAENKPYNPELGVGRKYRFNAKGSINTIPSQDLNIRIKLGSIVISSSSTITTSAFTYASEIEIDFDLYKKMNQIMSEEGGKSENLKNYLKTIKAFQITEEYDKNDMGDIYGIKTPTSKELSSTIVERDGKVTMQALNMFSKEKVEKAIKNIIYQGQQEEQENQQEQKEQRDRLAAAELVGIRTVVSERTNAWPAQSSMALAPQSSAPHNNTKLSSSIDVLLLVISTDNNLTKPRSQDTIYTNHIFREQLIPIADDPTFAEDMIYDS